LFQTEIKRKIQKLDEKLIEEIQKWLERWGTSNPKNQNGCRETPVTVPILC
jgi:hypothetical protein